MAGSVGWYRRDFTLPAGAFARYVPARFRSWIVRFESVNYDATVWLNGRQIGTHAGAYLPFEFDLKGVRSGRQPARRARRRPPRARRPARPAPAAAGGTSAASSARSTCARCSAPTCRRWWSGRSCPAPPARPRSRSRSSVRNTTGAPQTVVLQGAYGGLPLNFGGHTIAAGARPGSPTPAYDARSPAPVGARRPVPVPGHADAVRRRTGAGCRATSPTAASAASRSPRPASCELNGRVLNLRGVSIHEQNIATGAALDPAQLAALVGWAHELGADDHPRPLPAQPADRAARRPGRDPAVVRGPGLPGRIDQFLSQPAWLARRPRDAAREHPREPEPPVGAAVEHRQRAADAARPTPRPATSPAPPRSPTSSIPRGRWGWRSRTGPGWPARRPTRRWT